MENAALGNGEYDGKSKTTATATDPTPPANQSSPGIMRLLLWCLFTYLSKEFGIFLPAFQSKAGANTFIPASYKYDDENTHFDNSILTYGTDYALCVIMLYGAYQCLNATSCNSTVTHTTHGTHATQQLNNATLSKSLRIKSACLFFSYAISVFAGGYAHQTFTGGIDELNTIRFRIWWTVCVGTVTAAGGFMGACGSEIYKRLNLNGNPSRVRFRFLYVHDIMWVIYGGYMTWVCVEGGISYKRPACDIFAAGTTQFIPTVYCVLAVLSVKWNEAKLISEGQHHSSSDGVVDRIRQKVLYIFCVGFFLNAPLLPTYPLYIQYTSLSLGVVNTILHSNLTVAWSMQALSLCHFCEAFNYTGHGIGEKKNA